MYAYPGLHTYTYTRLPKLTRLLPGLACLLPSASLGALGTFGKPMPISISKCSTCTKNTEQIVSSILLFLWAWAF